MAASHCLRLLQGCHLNLYERHELLDSLYSPTPVSPELRLLIEALGLTTLTHDRDVAKRIRPR